jgi:cellulose synthase/poly-beta-1,6-N-acetylglucosamine synthase-like glycosyltransferase
MRVSLIVVARNAERTLPGLLKDVLEQDCDKNAIEVILVDGESEDGTRRLFEEFQRNEPGLKVAILRNKSRHLAGGWNIGLAASTGDVIIRIDAHARIAHDFVRNSMLCIESGQDICGGFRESICESNGSRSAFLAESSPFGGSLAGFRRHGKARYLDTVAHGAYRREVFKVVGGLDERLVRHQDNELHYRIKSGGFRIYYDPSIRSFHYCRRTVWSLIRQKFQIGLRMGPLLSVQPRCVSLRHLVPAVFVAGLLSLLALHAVPELRLAASVALLVTALLYGGAALVFAAAAVVNEPGTVKWAAFVLPVVFLSMHVAYGFGTLLGILWIPAFLWKWRGYRLSQPIATPGAHSGQLPSGRTC